MHHVGFTLFGTPIGECAIAWGAHGIVGVQLPEGTPAKTKARLRARFPGAHQERPPAAVEQALAGIEGVLSGSRPRLDDVALDMEWVPPFHREVYTHARAIPPGETSTYGDVAARLGRPRAARAVGTALRRNPFPVIVPCHRVLASGGKMGGFSATGGVDTKRRMLELEGWRASAQTPP
jgi:methylated-DNA-[protein]-cysteine S-methyltransferase